MIDSVYETKVTTLTMLRYLVVVAETGHFGRAAERCHVTQPTLSAQIAKWERICGLVVFERDRHGARLTQAGKPVVERAREILRAVGELEQLGNDYDPLAGHLSVGLIPTLAPYLLPHILPATTAAFPLLHCVVHEDLTDRLVAMVLSQGLDLAVIALPVPLDGLDHVPLFTEDFCAALPAAHPMARRKRLTERHLLDLPLLLLTEGHCLRDQALGVCRRLNRDSSAGINTSATSLETLRQLVLAGQGATLLPALSVSAADRSRESGIAIRPIADASARRELALVWRASDPRSASYQQLADTWRSAVPRDRLRLR